LFSTFSRAYSDRGAPVCQTITGPVYFPITANLDSLPGGWKRTAFCRCRSAR